MRARQYTRKRDTPHRARVHGWLAVLDQARGASEFPHGVDAVETVETVETVRASELPHGVARFRTSPLDGRDQPTQDLVFRRL